MLSVCKYTEKKRNTYTNAVKSAAPPITSSEDIAIGKNDESVLTA